MAKQKVTATPEGAAIRARAEQLLAHMSTRDVARQIKSEGLGEVSPRTVLRWAQERAAATETGEPVDVLSAAVAAALSEPEASEGPRGDSRTDLEVLAEHDRQIEAKLRDAIGDETTKRWTDLVTLRMRLRATMARMRPPPPRDREKDPLSLAARDEALARISRAVELAAGVAQ